MLILTNLPERLKKWVMQQYLGFIQHVHHFFPVTCYHSCCVFALCGVYLKITRSDKSDGYFLKSGL